MELKSEDTPFSFESWESIGFQVTTGGSAVVADERGLNVGIGSVDFAHLFNLAAQTIHG